MKSEELLNLFYNFCNLINICIDSCKNDKIQKYSCKTMSNSAVVVQIKASEYSSNKIVGSNLAKNKTR